MDSKDKKISDKFLWARRNNLHITGSQKLQITALKMAKAQDRLCMHITCNSEEMARSTKRNTSFSITCLSVPFLTKLKNYPMISHHHPPFHLLGQPRPYEIN
jgi:hypothetical protein